MKKLPCLFNVKRAMLCFTLLIPYSLFLTPNLCSAQITYPDVAPIFYAHCTTCHHNGGIGPMPLMNYSETLPYSAIIKSYLQQGLMPPWMPDTTYCRFVNERIISQSEKNEIIAWIDSTSAKGDTALAPPAPVYTSTYKLKGTPDLIVKEPVYTSTATINDAYICIAIPTGLLTDRIIRAFEIVPGNAAIVHHVLVNIDTTGTATSDYSGNCYLMPGSNVGVGGYAPGAGPTIFPGTPPLTCGMPIKAGSTIVLQIHYPVGTAGQNDSTQVRFFFYPPSYSMASVRQVYTTTPLQNWNLSIPANTIQNWTANDANNTAVSLFSVFPHHHKVGVSLKVCAYKGIDTIPLIRINNWNFHWQGYYFYPSLIKIPAGYTLYSTHTYNNTAANPNNPYSPPQPISAGFNTTNEMLFDSFQYLMYETGDENIDIQQLIDNDTLLAVPIVKALPIGIITHTYPNPFNEQIHITFQLPSPAMSTVTIYDIRGSIIRTYAKRNTTAAFNDIVWDGKNNQGATVSAGTYFYNINAGTLSYSGKIVMVRKTI